MPDPLDEETPRSTALKPHASDAEIERVFACLARNSGNLNRTTRELKANGDIAPDRSTILRWRRAFSDRYERIRQEVIPQIREDLAEQHVELAAKQIEASHALLDQLMENREELKPHQIAPALGKVDVGSGIHTQRAKELRESPILQELGKQTAAQIMDALKAKGYEVDFIEGEAEEID